MNLDASAVVVPRTLRNVISVRGGRFHIHTDEPVGAGGDDSAPSPHELLAASLAGCIATTLAMYARTKDWDLGDVRVDVDYDNTSTPRRFSVDIHLSGAFTGDELVRLEKVAATCPVRRALEADVVVEERLHAHLPAEH